LSTGHADTPGRSSTDGGPQDAIQDTQVQQQTGRRVCLLTGASGRLGTYFCNHFAGEYDIVAVYLRNRPQVSAADAQWFDPLNPEREVDANLRQVFTVRADLTNDQECTRVVELALARYDRIDLLVNGAVSSVWSSMLYSDHLRHSGYSQFATNVLAPLNLSTAVARQFWQGRDQENRLYNRNIVNVSSIAGLNIYTGSGQSLYAASKAALNQLTGHMADEFSAIGIRVNATAPNSFPSIIPTSRAADAIVRLDHGTENGVIVVGDGEVDTVIQLSPYNKSNQ
jgi:NAD(P)-dependent dehydrogenase (short-subunit alcohol dehydrogenase family)